jgi:hypothetical protein
MDRFQCQSSIGMGSHVTHNADMNMPTLRDQGPGQMRTITCTRQQPDSPLAILLSVHQDGAHCHS